ncbi:MAG TPA: alpha/beta hydrolase [Gemmatimonadales bacterium]|nr:alpha/beta hydrolase [Gemmatimonadales bacterium]
MTPPREGPRFVHRFERGAGPAGRHTLLLLHGTGGDESDLLPIGRMLLPGASLLSPRGQVLENGMPRFFRRLAEGVFDQADLRSRTDELADFVGWAVAAYGLPHDGVIAVGYSNGANIAASVLLRRPGVLGGAVLFRPMVPFEPDRPPDLAGVPVLVTGGRDDPICPPGETERLAGLLRRSGADVTVRWREAGHGLVREDVSDAARWLDAVLRDRSAPSPDRRG